MQVFFIIINLGPLNRTILRFPILKSVKIFFLIFFSGVERGGQNKMGAHNDRLQGHSLKFGTLTYTELFRKAAIDNGN